MTVSELFTIVRRDIGDTGSTRWSDSVLLNYYNAFRQIAWTRKPFIFYINSILTAAPASVSSTSGDIDFDVSWSPAAVDYVDYRCLYEDSEDSNVQSLSQDHYNKFVTMLT